MTSWLTLSEYLTASDLSRTTFFRRLRAGAISKKGIGAKTVYSVASLTVEQRAKLDSRSDLTAQTEIAAGTQLLFADQSATAVQTRIALTPEAQHQAEERYAIIKPLLDFVSDASARARFAMLKLKDGRQVTTANLLADYLAEIHSTRTDAISSRTIWRWKKAFTDGGVNALARGVRSDKGQSKWFSRYPGAAQLVASTYLKPWQTVSSAYSTLLREAHLFNVAEGDLPSYETVRSYLDTIPKPISVLAREGERAYTERMTPYVKRGYTDVPANHLWVADHMIHDVVVRNDCFEGVTPNAPMRLRFSGFIDMRSRKFVGYCWAPEGNSRVITTAIRRGIERYGAPEIVYCDNGADYKKVAKYARPVGQEWREEEYNALAKTGVLQRLGVAVQFCMPYHPQSKLIERAFRTFHLKFDAMFPHYTTGNAYTKPDQTVIAMNEHRKLLKIGDGGSSPLVPASTFIQMATTWLEQDYNAGHRHSGQGMEGRTPNEVFDALYPEQSRRTTDPMILSQLLFESQKRRVRECTVTLNGRRYTPANPNSSAVMHLANETEVLVCYDPHSLDQAVIADLDGRMIAEVRAEVLLPHSADAMPAIAESFKERRRLRNATVSTVRQIHQGVANMGHKSDLQLLHERSLLPAAVGDSVVHRMTETKEAPLESKQLHTEDIADRFIQRRAATYGAHS